MSDSQQWKVKFQELMQTCQSELKKTADLGKKMISAGQSNTQLNEAYKELGELVVKELKSGKLEWENLRANKLVESISQLKEELDQLESDVQKIKNN